MNSDQGSNRPSACPCCRGRDFQCVHIYDKRPTGETVFFSEDTQRYHRELWRCETCGHYRSTHRMDLSSLYQADYVDATYGGLEGIRRNFDRVMGLDPAKSDNVGRVQRVIAFAEAHFGKAAPLSILDVGSGLGVFLAKVRQSTSWTCTAMEPDPRFAQHVRDVLGIEAVAEDYLTNEWNRQFDIITLNKVLEHVEDPAVMLSRCRRDLSPNGLLYVELPDGECAARDADGFGREEFFIEHHHVFTMASMELATRNAGFLSVATERLREPSGKYTLRSFLRPAGNPSATVPS